MKKILILASFLALAYFTWKLVFNENFSMIEPYDSQFKLEDAKNRASKVEIIEANGYKLKLEKSKETGNWFCNDYYLARKDAVDQLLRTVERWRVDKPIKESNKSKIKQELESKGKQVKYYYDYDHDEPVKHYYLGGTPPSRKGTYMLLNKAESPYIVKNTHLVGSPEIIFHTVLEKWRTHRIYGGNSQSINNVSVNFLEEKDKSYKVLRTNDGLELAENPNVTIQQGKTVEKIALKVLFDKIPKLNIESFDNLYSKKDSIMNTPPYCTINIESKDERLNQEIQLFRMPVNDKTKIMKLPEGEKQIYDQDRFYATINKGKDFVVVQKYGLSDILNKSYSGFWVED